MWRTVYIGLKPLQKFEVSSSTVDKNETTEGENKRWEMCHLRYRGERHQNTGAWTNQVHIHQWKYKSTKHYRAHTFLESPSIMSSTINLDCIEYRKVSHRLEALLTWSANKALHRCFLYFCNHGWYPGYIFQQRGYIVSRGRDLFSEDLAVRSDDLVRKAALALIFVELRDADVCYSPIAW